MKTILFFSRMRLAYLYGELNSTLFNEYHCIHVAYSEYENKILENNYSISCEYVLKEYIKHNEVISSPLLIEEMDNFIIIHSNGRFNLNSAIQSDRGFKYLNQSESYKLATIYYIFWKNIFNKYNIDCFFHEATSLFFNFIASLFCIKHNTIYSDLVGVPYYDKAFLFITSNNGGCIQFSKHYGGNVDNLKDIENFKSYLNKKYSSIAKFEASKNYLKLFYRICKQEIYIFVNKISNNIDYFFDNTDYYILHERNSLNKFKNLLFYNFINWDQPNYAEKYYYYSMNLEPEAVIEYFGDGLYRNQIKLIENIASQLPPNHFLYVKDHVVEFGYRNYTDYLHLKKLHNVKVIHPSIPGSQLIKNSFGVIAICGTAILEAIFFKKIAYMFGNFYYTESSNVIQVHNIKDLRKILYSNIQFSDKDYILFLSAYLKSLNLGDTNLFTTGTEKLILDSKNIFSISNAIKNLLK